MAAGNDHPSDGLAGYHAANQSILTNYFGAGSDAVDFGHWKPVSAPRPKDGPELGSKQRNAPIPVAVGGRLGNMHCILVFTKALG